MVRCQTGRRDPRGVSVRLWRRLPLVKFTSVSQFSNRRLVPLGRRFPNSSRFMWSDAPYRFLHRNSNRNENKTGV
jgi:hypothetical protein